MNTVATSKVGTTLADSNEDLRRMIYDLCNRINETHIRLVGQPCAQPHQGAANDTDPTGSIEENVIANSRAYDMIVMTNSALDDIIQRIGL